MDVFHDVINALTSVPAGRYAVGVSGGADSVALLTLLAGYRPDLSMHVVHLNHQFRGADSAADAAFVVDLARKLGLPVTIATRTEIEPLLPETPRNREALGRACRLMLFQRVVREHNLSAVLVAHHADDQAETILLSLARGGGEWTLRGMSPVKRIGDLEIRRPLLKVRPKRLREWLVSIGQEFREDASNATETFARNRARRLHERNEPLRESVLLLGRHLDDWCDWIDSAAPRLTDQFAMTDLSLLSPPLARRAAMRWLIEVAACPAEECSAAVIGRLLAMSVDAASPPRQQFPGGATVRRRGRVISVAPRGASTRPTVRRASR
jgi:tRNA(Ile)-lysidine synthetase-like protein